MATVHLNVNKLKMPSLEVSSYSFLLIVYNNQVFFRMLNQMQIQLSSLVQKMNYLKSMTTTKHFIVNLKFIGKLPCKMNFNIIVNIFTFTFGLLA